MVKFMHLYAPYFLIIFDDRGLIATPMCRQGAYEEKKVCKMLSSYKFPIITGMEAAGGLPVHGM